MMQIAEASLLPVLKSAGYEGYELKKSFVSKRNSVFLLAVSRSPRQQLAANAEAEQELASLAAMGLFEVGKGCEGCSGGDCSSCAVPGQDEELVVWKQYEQGDTMYELAMLKLLRNNRLKTPTVLAASDAGILLQYVQGVNLCELFAQAEREHDYAEEIVFELVRWFKRYYEATGGKSRGDINLRNFIYNEEEHALYGLDFENTNFRSPVYDIGDLLAYLINYEPAFSDWKCEWLKRVASAFIVELRLSATELRKQYQAALHDLEQRRSVAVPPYIFDLLDEI